MKRVQWFVNAGMLGLGLLLALLCLHGCVIDLGVPVVVTPVVNDDPMIELVSLPGAIYRPLIGSGDDWVGVPFERTRLLFGTGKDQYGNAVGLADDRIWSITDVTIRCELKAVDDTVYNPGDAQQRHGFSADWFQNACVWYPLYTGNVEPISGYLYAPYPEVGYAFDSCADLGTKPYPTQMATITARAKADHIRIKITVPLHAGGTYTLDMPGATPQSGNVFELAVGTHGPIDVVWQSGAETQIYTVTIPVEWFWATGTWTIDVMATGAC